MGVDERQYSTLAVTSARCALTGPTAGQYDRGSFGGNPFAEVRLAIFGGRGTGRTGAFPFWLFNW